MDWTGNRKSTFATLGASNHSEGERQKDDYYATEPKATQVLLDVEKFNLFILEPACGEGHMSKVILNNGYNCFSSDKIDRGYGDVKDFFQYSEWHGDIITNPPYKYAKEFVEHSLKIIKDGQKVAMFLKLTFLEGKSRKTMFLENPPKTIYVSSSRLKCAKNGDFDNTGTSAAAYAWYIWEKGYKGESVVRWIN